MGVSFGTYHSRNDYGLDYLHKDIAAPKAKVVSVNIPLRQGVLDLTSRLTGDAPVFNNRTITLQFEMRGLRSTWMRKWSTIAANLHGRIMDVALDEDPGWYWTGRVSVNALEDHGASAGLKITVDAFPFKWSTGLVEVGSYTLSGETTETFAIPYQVALPIFDVTGNTQITYNGEIFVATPSVKSPPGLYLKTGIDQDITIDGSGACTFAYRGGIL